MTRADNFIIKFYNLPESRPETIIQNHFSQLSALLEEYEKHLNRINIHIAKRKYHQYINHFNRTRQNREYGKGNQRRKKFHQLFKAEKRLKEAKEFIKRQQEIIKRFDSLNYPDGVHKPDGLQ